MDLFVGCVCVEEEEKPGLRGWLQKWWGAQGGPATLPKANEKWLQEPTSDPGPRTCRYRHVLRPHQRIPLNSHFSSAVRGTAAI
jgi:hypothetical protein